MCTTVVFTEYFSKFRNPLTGAKIHWANCRIKFVNSVEAATPVTCELPNNLYICRLLPSLQLRLPYK